MTLPPIAKRAYETAAMLALFNMLALGAMGAYLCAAGAIDGEKLQRIGMVLRGEALTETGEGDPGAVDQSANEAGAEPTEGALSESQMSLEIMRREADRIKEELRQQQNLANSIMILVETQREAYQGERARRAKEEEAATKQRSTEGAKKEIDILKGVKAKLAVTYLLGMENPDEAAHIMLAMDTRAAKKIVEAAKRPEQVVRMREILKRMRQAAPDRTGEWEP